MCRATTCNVCGKATWAGCGAHVEQVLAGVPTEARCQCTADDLRAAKAASGGWLRRLVGRADKPQS